MVDLARAGEMLRYRSRQAIENIRIHLPGNFTIPLDGYGLLDTDALAAETNLAIRMACDSFKRERTSYDQKARDKTIIDVEDLLNGMFQQINKSRHLPDSFWRIDCLSLRPARISHELGTRTTILNRQFFGEIMLAKTPELAAEIVLSSLAEENEHYPQVLAVVALSVQRATQNLDARELALAEIPNVCTTYEELIDIDLKRIYPHAPDRETREKLFAALVNEVRAARQGRLLSAEEESFAITISESFKHVREFTEAYAKLMDENKVIIAMEQIVARENPISVIDYILANQAILQLAWSWSTFNRLRQIVQDKAIGKWDEAAVRIELQELRKIWLVDWERRRVDYRKAYDNQPHEKLAQAWAERIVKHGLELFRAQQGAPSGDELGPPSQDMPPKDVHELPAFESGEPLNLLEIGKAAGDSAAREAAMITKDVAIEKLERQGFATFLKPSADRSINWQMSSLISGVFSNNRFIVEEAGIRRIDRQAILELAQKLVRAETNPRIVESIYLILTESLQEAMASVYAKHLGQDPKNLAVPTGLTQEEVARISSNLNTLREATRALAKAGAASSPALAPKDSVQAQSVQERKIDLSEDDIEKDFTDEKEKLKREIDELRNKRIDLQRVKSSGEVVLAESQPSRVKPGAEIEKVKQAIQEKLRAQMNLISGRITSLYEPWRERIQKLEERRRDLEDGIEFYFPRAES